MFRRAIVNTTRVCQRHYSASTTEETIRRLEAQVTRNTKELNILLPVNAVALGVSIGVLVVGTSISLKN